MFTGSVRPAVDGDVEDIARLLVQLSYNVPVAKLHQFLHQRPLYHMDVVEDAGCVLGFVSWYESECLLTTHARRHIEALVVDEGARRRGVGQALLAHVESTTRPCIVELVSSIQRVPTGTHDFYTHQGYGDLHKHGKMYFRKILN